MFPEEGDVAATSSGSRARAQGEFCFLNEDRSSASLGFNQLRTTGEVQVVQRGDGKRGELWITNHTPPCEGTACNSCIILPRTRKLTAHSLQISCTDRVTRWCCQPSALHAGVGGSSSFFWERNSWLWVLQVGRDLLRAFVV